MICQCWFTNCNMCTILVEDINGGSGAAVCWGWYMGTLYIFCSIFLKKQINEYKKMTVQAVNTWRNVNRYDAYVSQLGPWADFLGSFWHGNVLSFMLTLFLLWVYSHVQNWDSGSSELIPSPRSWAIASNPGVRRDLHRSSQWCWRERMPDQA